MSSSADKSSAPRLDPTAWLGRIGHRIPDPVLLLAFFMLGLSFGF